MLHDKKYTPGTKLPRLESLVCLVLAGCGVVLPLAVWLLWPHQAAALDQFTVLDQVPWGIRLAGLAGSLPAGIAFAIGLVQLSRFISWAGPLSQEAVRSLRLSAGWLFGGSIWLAVGKWGVSGLIYLSLAGRFPRPPYMLILGALLLLAFSGVLRRAAEFLEENIEMRDELRQII